MSGPSPKIALPVRTTRGKRLREAVDDEEGAADEEFWAQEFFAEEQADNDFKSEDEKEVEDVPDSDFDESEEEDEEVQGQEHIEKRKKSLKPPGASTKPSKPKVPKAPDPSAVAAAPLTAEEKAAAKAAAAAEKEARAAAEKLDAPVLRRSTMARAAEAEQRREYRQERSQTYKKKPKSGSASGWKPMTQTELLAEAAQTEIENLTSLKLLLAREEEVRRKALVVKVKHTGPTIRFHSRKVDNHEQTTFGCLHMSYALPWLLPSFAPPQAPHPTRCVVTGQPAKYRDPETAQPYSDVAAFRRLRNLPPLQPGERPVAELGYIGSQQHSGGGAGSVQSLEVPPAGAPHALPPALALLVLDLHSSLTGGRQWRG